MALLCTRPWATRCCRCTQEHLAPVFAKRHIGVTIQIDEGSEVYNAKHSNLHPLFT